MELTEGYHTANTQEAKELLLSRGYKPTSELTFTHSVYNYLTRPTTSRRIIGTVGIPHNSTELYCYDEDFHETPKQEAKITRPPLAELLQIDELTLTYLQNKLTWKESLEYQLDKFTAIKKNLAEQLDSTKDNYSELLRQIKYYDGAIEDVKGNLC